MCGCIDKLRSNPRIELAAHEQVAPPHAMGWAPLGAHEVCERTRAGQAQISGRFVGGEIGAGASHHHPPRAGRAAP